MINKLDGQASKVKKSKISKKGLLAMAFFMLPSLLVGFSAAPAEAQAGSRICRYKDEAGDTSWRFVEIRKSESNANACKDHPSGAWFTCEDYTNQHLNGKYGGDVCEGEGLEKIDNMNSSSLSSHHESEYLWAKG